jgi:hypothetical protein
MLKVPDVSRVWPGDVELEAVKFVGTNQLCDLDELPFKGFSIIGVVVDKIQCARVVDKYVRDRFFLWVAPGPFFRFSGECFGTHENSNHEAVF